MYIYIYSICICVYTYIYMHICMCVCLRVNNINSIINDISQFCMKSIMSEYMDWLKLFTRVLFSNV